MSFPVLRSPDSGSVGPAQCGHVPCPLTGTNQQSLRPFGRLHLHAATYDADLPDRHAGAWSVDSLGEFWSKRVSLFYLLISCFGFSVSLQVTKVRSTESLKLSACPAPLPAPANGVTKATPLSSSISEAAFCPKGPGTDPTSLCAHLRKLTVSHLFPQLVATLQLLVPRPPTPPRW